MIKKLFSIGNIKTYLILIVVGVLIWIFKDWQKEKTDRIRLEDNLESIITEKNVEISQYKLTHKEFEKYTTNANNQLAELQTSLKRANIKLRKVSKLVSTTFVYTDTTKYIVELDSLKTKINELSKFKIPFSIKNDCAIIEGKFVYSNGNSDLIFTKSQVTDTINQIVSWHRKKRKILFFKVGIGKKIYETTTFSKCVKPKTITIDIIKR